MAGGEAGWHPDPSARHQWRYWDGQRWTDRVADGAVVAIDPLPPADQAAPVAAGTRERVQLDTTVPAGVRGKRRVVVTDRAFYDAGRAYPFPAITSLSHQVTRFHGKSGRTLNFVYDLWIATGDKPKRIYWSGGGPHERGVYDAVVEALHRYVTPRIVRELVARMDLGETIKMGSLRLASQGIARKKLLKGNTDVAPWSPRIEMVAKDGSLFVYDRGDYVGSVSLKEPNAAVLPALADTMGRGGGPAAAG